MLFLSAGLTELGKSMLQLTNCNPNSVLLPTGMGRTDTSLHYFLGSTITRAVTA
jgi:hypothetical protein